VVVEPVVIVGIAIELIMAIVVAMKSWPKGLRINICGGFGVFMGVLQTDRNFLELA